MISEEDFAIAVGIDPPLAFVRLERRFRSVLERNLESSQSNDAGNSYVVEYLNHTIATAKALGLDLFADWPLPSEGDGRLWDEYKRFITEVDHYAVQIQIAHVREPSKNTVALDQTEKRVIRHYVEQIKTVIDESGVEVAKKERLYDKINDFLIELDRDRTPLQVVSDIVIALAHTGGEAAKELEPAWKWVKLIGEIFGARQDNERVGLPKPKEQKKLEGPKRKPEEPRRSNRQTKPELDDEIPF